jgi:hypothetical protein
MHYFDYERIAREADIPADKLVELCRLVRQEFPWDEMMYELHLLRMCLAIRDGHVTVEEVLKPEPTAQA